MNHRADGGQEFGGELEIRRMAPRLMWPRGAFWLTASVRAKLRCRDLADLLYTIALSAIA